MPIDEARVKHWQERFQELAPDHRDTDTPRSTRPGTGAGLRHRFVLVDGFLMFYDQQVSDLLDVRILIRARKDVLKARRLARNERVRLGNSSPHPLGVIRLFHDAALGSSRLGSARGADTASPPSTPRR